MVKSTERKCLIHMPIRSGGIVVPELRLISDVDVDDHRAGDQRGVLLAGAEEPLDARLLHEGDHASVVDVPEGVHVRPPDPDLGDECVPGVIETPVLGPAVESSLR